MMFRRGLEHHGPDPSPAVSRAVRQTRLMIRRRVRVVGRVQGVGFRFSCRREAEVRGVTGWVTNCYDGAVEAVFEGSPAAVDAMIEWCRRGPMHALVLHVEVTDEQPRSESGFVIV